MDREKLRHYVSGGEIDERYFDPKFWLGGDYVSHSTNKVEFRKLGNGVVDWAFQVARQNPNDFARWMCINTSVPKVDNDQLKARRASRIYEYMLFMQGTVASCSSALPDDPQYLSPEARLQMEDYALETPFLTDQIKVLALRELEVRGKPQNASVFRREGGSLPTPQFTYWRELFPRIFAEVYENVSYDEHGFLSDYSVRQLTPGYLAAIDPISDTY